MYDPDDAEEKTRVAEAIKFSPSDPTEDALVLIYPPGTDMGRKYELAGKVGNIGRDPSNHIVVDSDSVSRRHARLTIETGRRLATDLQSTNGTYVNNEPILSHFLENGDQIKIGDTIFKYLVGSDVESSYHEEIYQMTIKDGLTEVYNKRYFLEGLDREMSRAQRHDRELSILLFDIDHFKNVNDTYGHLAGDYVLQALARLVSTRARREEVFARYGGEEFVILLPETSKEGAIELAEQLRKRVASHTFIFEGEEIPITVSVGVATMSGDATTATEFIKGADMAMYKAKSDGRNCVRG
ncbi:MAG: GGDEF domain-containing protein [Deltaproteobacteria bacterium]|nr:GGDEF domain-containing protein [Deltaproteobacteria bacterium]